MSRAKNVTFDQRVGRIVRHHKSLKKGAVAQIGPDGLLTVRPRRIGLHFPWRGLVMTVILVLVAKGGLYAYLGAATYADRIAALQAGTGVERFGAWLMAPDRATEALAAYIAPLL